MTGVSMTKLKDVDKFTKDESYEYCECEFIANNLFDNRDRKVGSYDCFEKHYVMCKKCGKQQGFSYYKIIDELEEINSNCQLAKWNWLLLARKHALVAIHTLKDDEMKDKYAQYINFLFRDGKKSVHLQFPD